MTKNMKVNKGVLFMKLKNILAFGLSFCLCCGISSAEAAEKDNNVLIAYYSRSGNTAKVAEYIADVLPADLFEIKEKDKYPSDYGDLTKRAKKEIADGYKPALENDLPSVDKYDVIFIGSPCWWGTYTPPVASFLAKHNFDGKKIVFFMTHGGSGLGHSLSDFKKQLPEADVIGQKAFYGSRVKNSENEIKTWVEELKL